MSETRTRCEHVFRQCLFGGWELETGCGKLFYVPGLPPGLEGLEGECPACGTPVVIRIEDEQSAAGGT
jgi:hypothetical protein